VIPPDQPSDRRANRSLEDQADLDKHLRNSATRQQAKQRRLNGDEPVRRRQIALDQLPLFADEKSLSEAFLGRGKYTHWRAVVPLLERRGFPTIDGLMGGDIGPPSRRSSTENITFAAQAKYQRRMLPRIWKHHGRKQG
jgi:hypothetical protein